MGTVRGYARDLEKKKYLLRKKRVQDTNRFHLEPLFDALEKVLEKVKAEKQAKRSGEAEESSPAA